MIRVVVGSTTARPTAISVEELFALATTPALFGAQTFTFVGVLAGEGEKRLST